MEITFLREKIFIGELVPGRNCALCGARYLRDTHSFTAQISLPIRGERRGNRVGFKLRLLPGLQ